jgi:5'(3')-deoxyribonucleotidase
MDNVLVDFSSGLKRISEEDRIKYKGKFDEVPGIFNLMDPLPNAIESYHELSKIFDTYILSTAPWENISPWSDKIKWVHTYLPDKAYKRLILSHHKDLLRGDYLIDDRKKNGAQNFKGELILFGSEDFPDWKSVVSYLKKKR